MDERSPFDRIFSKEWNQLTRRWQLLQRFVETADMLSRDTSASAFERMEILRVVVDLLPHPDDEVPMSVMNLMLGMASLGDPLRDAAFWRKYPGVMEQLDAIAAKNVSQDDEPEEDESPSRLGFVSAT